MAGPVVVKVGGELIGAEASAPLCAALASVHRDGLELVVVHGGGPQATALSGRLGLESTLVAGQRVTTPEVLVAAKMAICGQASVDLTAAARRAGLPALGLAGVSGIVRAVRRPPIAVAGIERLVDYGEVGDVDGVDAASLRGLLAAGFVPLVSPLALDEAGAVLNVNADLVASAVASGLHASALVMFTGANGVMRSLDDPGSRFPRLDAAAARALIADGVIVGGMIPKVDEALGALAAGVDRVIILPGARPDALGPALAGSTEVGTTFVSDSFAG